MMQQLPRMSWREIAMKMLEWKESGTKFMARTKATAVEQCKNMVRRMQQLDEDDEDEIDMQSMLYLAPLRERVKDEENIFKLCQEGWQGRHFVLTKSNIFLSHPGVETMSERIPLHEISIVKKYDSLEAIELEGVQEVMEFAFVIKTLPGGYAGGREYCFRLGSQESCDEFVQLLIEVATMSAKTVGFENMVEGWKARARDLIQSKVWQTVVSLLIGANFAINLAQSSTDTEGGSNSAHIFNTLDSFFTIIFAIELVVNLFGNWLRPFLRDGWSVFDLVVVTVSLASLLLPQAPGVSILRLMRTFRVLRLFKKLRSLRTIMNSLAISMYPVFNAFLIVGLVLFVYAILGVQLYNEIAPDEFGTFTSSVWTMFRVSTFDGWSETFDLISTKHHSKYTGPDASPALFMGSFILVICWILQPLVMAVMLDNFVEAVKTEKHKMMVEAEEKARRKAQQIKPEVSLDGTQKGVHSQRQYQGSPLTPLLESLSRFKDAEDLTRRIQDVFKMLDVDLGGTISFDEMREGLRKMDFEPSIDLTSDYFSVLTKRGALCDAAGNLNPQNFEAMLYEEVQQYTYDKVARAFEDSSTKSGNVENGAMLASLKWLMMRDEMNNFGRPTASKAKRKPFDLQDFIDSCRKLSAWQEEVKHVRDVEMLLRKDLEDMRAANLELSSMLRKELQDVSRDMLALRQDLHLHIRRSEVQQKYVSNVARDAVEEFSSDTIHQHVVGS